MPGPGLYQIVSAVPQDKYKLLVIPINGSVGLTNTSSHDTAQGWNVVPARDGAGYGLVNALSGQCMARASNTNGTSLVMLDSSEIDTNDLAVWRDDTVPGVYNAINSFADWEQKLNIAGNGPYNVASDVITWNWSGGAPNELWAMIALG